MISSCYTLTSCEAELKEKLIVRLWHGDVCKAIQKVTLPMLGNEETQIVKTTLYRVAALQTFWIRLVQFCLCNYKFSVLLFVITSWLMGTL